MKDVNVILAEHPGLGRVCLCECNSVHVNIGPITLNLEPAAFLQMAALLCNAADQLSAIREQRETPETLFRMLGPSSNRITH
jgi:hypothetical protein